MSSRRCLPPPISSADSVRPGLLVKNYRDPQQSSLDPLENSDAADSHYTTRPMKDFFHSTDYNRSSRLRSYLTDIISLKYGSSRSLSATIKAVEATYCVLKDITNYYQKACRHQKTKEWIEEAERNDENVYLITRTFILKDAIVRQEQGGGAGGAQSAGSSLATANFGTATSTPILMSAGISMESFNTHNNLYTFETPGDNVFGIEYQKVKFRWLSSKEVVNSFLGPAVQWKSYGTFWRGADDEEDDDEIFEASLEEPEEDEIQSQRSNVDGDEMEEDTEMSSLEASHCICTHEEEEDEILDSSLEELEEDKFQLPQGADMESDEMEDDTEGPSVTSHCIRTDQEEEMRNRRALLKSLKKRSPNYLRVPTGRVMKGSMIPKDHRRQAIVSEHMKRRKTKCWSPVLKDLRERSLGYLRVPKRR